MYVHMYVHMSVICHNINVQRMVRVILKTKQCFNKMSAKSATHSHRLADSSTCIFNEYGSHQQRAQCQFGSLGSSKDIPKSQCLVSCCRGHSTPIWTSCHIQPWSSRFGGQREAKHGEKGLEVKDEVENVTSKLKDKHENERFRG